MAIAAAAQPAAATAAWTHSGTGTPTAKAVSMPTGATPTASVSNRSVTVSWSASTMPGGGAVSGYLVRRYDTNGNVQTIGSGCSGTISALTCTETSVPGGSWRYTVTPVRGNWMGFEGSLSSNAVVASPSLSFTSSTTVTSLPTTLNGTIAAFVGGQTVTFRLDNASTGTVLTGTLSPTPVPSGGGASVTVTIPTGTSNGSHTVYVVGSGGDVASASITVSLPFTMTTSGWDLRDASSGTESNQSAQPAFQDAITFTSGLWPAVFNTANYLDFEPNAPLRPGLAVTGAAFNFRYAAAAAGETACYWFEVRRASTNAVLGTHGSAGTPVGCTTGTALTSVSTNLAELSTTDLADDARVRVYGRESASKSMTMDVATITGSTSSPSMSFTLYTQNYTDAAAGSPTTYQWSLAGTGGLAYTTTNNWTAAFSASRYLKVTFPGYVPSGATVTGGTFKTSYRPTQSGRNACYYFEVYSGATLIGTHGSTASPVSCNSTSTYQNDSVPLSEINTPARANGAIVKMYYWISGNQTRTTDHDLAQLLVDYQ
ncbi:MAG TPA: hypothetical protein VJT75_07160 [Thermoleophilaceae bacterium]|nr:hypothetical protein [Thermoleophilaceae bacterium]